MADLRCRLGLHRWHLTNGRVFDFGLGARCVLMYDRQCVRCPAHGTKADLI